MLSPVYLAKRQDSKSYEKMVWARVVLAHKILENRPPAALKTRLKRYKPIPLNIKQY